MNLPLAGGGGSHGRMGIPLLWKTTSTVRVSSVSNTMIPTAPAIALPTARESSPSSVGNQSIGSVTLSSDKTAEQKMSN